MCVLLLWSPMSPLGILLAAVLLPRTERSRLDSLTSCSSRTSVRVSAIGHDRQPDVAIIPLVIPMTTTRLDVVGIARLASTAVGLHHATTTTHAIVTLLLLAVDHLVLAHWMTAMDPLAAILTIRTVVLPAVVAIMK